MTAEELRAEAIDRLARFEYEITHPPHAYLDPAAWTWDARPESSRDLYREWAARRIDALGDMLPTGMERGYDWGEPDPEEPGPCSYTADDEVFSKLEARGPVWKRYVSSWQQETE